MLWSEGFFCVLASLYSHLSAHVWESGSLVVYLQLSQVEELRFMKVSYLRAAQLSHARCMVAIGSHSFRYWSDAPLWHCFDGEHKNEGCL